MLFNIFQKDFYNGIQIVEKAVSSKSTMTILTGIYIEAVLDKGIHLIANNLEIGIEYWVDAEIKEEGAIVLPAVQLTNIIRELPAADVLFKADMEHFNVNINCLNSEFNIKGFEADEFPQLPEIKGSYSLKVPSLNYKEMIDEVKFATSNDQTQPALTGGLMSINDNSMNLVTTNTYRLAFSKINNTSVIDQNINVILPGNTLNELSHLIDNDNNEDLTMLISENYIRFNFNDIVFISRLIEGKFPNYQQVLPDSSNTKVKIDRTEFSKAVKRVSLIARHDTNVVTLIINQNWMDIKSNKSDIGNAHETIEIELEGDTQKIDVDANYLMDVLKVLKEDTIVIELIGSLNPLTIKKEINGDYIYLIMPVRPGA
ncbi:MAG: DNA polymerase III subunit beta [Firmicutes bacterium]|nr:DNA polymerase III subunit beta [Bacillota bacterium]